MADRLRTPSGPRRPRDQTRHTIGPQFVIIRIILKAPTRLDPHDFWSSLLYQHYHTCPVPGHMTVPRLQGLDNAAAQQVVATAQALGLGRADQAAAQLAPALSAFPGHPEVLRLHAGVLTLRGQYPEALATMQRALDLRPVDPLYHNTMGTVLGTTGDFDGAVRALHRACELQPDMAIAWYNLGVMLTRCVRIAEATDALQRAAQLDPANMDARALLGDM